MLLSLQRNAPINNTFKEVVEQASPVIKDLYTEPTNVFPSWIKTVNDIHVSSSFERCFCYFVDFQTSGQLVKVAQVLSGQSDIILQIRLHIPRRS